MLSDEEKLLTDILRVDEEKKELDVRDGKGQWIEVKEYLQKHMEDVA